MHSPTGGNVIPDSDVTHRDLARHDGGSLQETTGEIKHATSRHDATLHDDPEDLARAAYTLSVDQILNRLDVEGIAKSRRSVQRYLKRGDIEARCVETSNGQRWLANELDVARFIEELKRKEALALAGKDTVIEEASSIPASDTQRHDATERAAPLGGVAILEERVSHLQERLSERSGEVIYLRSQVESANDHIKLWSDRAKELKDLLQAQTDGTAPVLAAMARSLNDQSAATNDADTESVPPANPIIYETPER